MSPAVHPAIISRFVKIVTRRGKARLGFIPLCALIVAMATTRARSQCDYEWKTDAAYPGVNTTVVQAITSWDPDGPGPQPELTVVGGNFPIAGKYSVNNIAAWDGTHWMPLGTGIPMPSANASFTPVVTALAVFNGQLIAAGNFTEAGGVPAQNISEWDGTNWHPIGEGLPAPCWALINFDGSLIASGYDWANSVGYLRRWNGNQWLPMESGTSFVYAFTVFQGNLLGAFGNEVRRWDGAQWQPFTAPLAPYVGSIHTLVEFEGDLVVGGSFTSAGGVQARNVARWDGQAWRSMGSGFLDSEDVAEVRLSMVVDGRLYVGGSLTLPHWPEQAGVAQWSGEDWLPLGTAWGDPSSMGTRAGKLLVGGRISAGGDSTVGGNILHWDGSDWSGLIDHEPPKLRQITGFQGDLYAIGKDSSDHNYWRNSSILRFQNDRWESIGTAETSTSSHGFNRLFVMGSRLYAAGVFQSVSGVPAHSIAAWDGQSWTPLGEGMGENESVDDLIEFDGRLIASGGFSSAGGQAIRSIAAWDGTTWSSLGGGLGGPTPNVDISVRSLLVQDGGLIVGGYFQYAGGQPVTSLARWDGANWSAFGDPLEGGSSIGPVVISTALHHNRVIIGGSFTIAGGQVVNHLAEWTGSAWQSLGGGVSGQGVPDTFGPGVWSIAINGDDLYIGGPFITAGTVRANGVARWDGTQWHALGTPPGVGGDCSYCGAWISEIASQFGSLRVYGYFSSAGGVASYGSARWAPVDEPVVVQQPASLARCSQQSATLTVAVAAPSPQTTYQWRRAFVQLTDGAEYAGTTTATLTVYAASLSTVGTYDCVISNGACGSTVSLPASLSIVASGNGDGNGDGRTDGRDIQAFVGVLTGGGGASASCGFDMDHDGAVNAADLPGFIANLLGN